MPGRLNEPRWTERLAEYRAAHVPLYNRQPLKLGLFGVNANGTLFMTEAPSSHEVSWQHSLEIAELADRIGLEAIIPVARWRGFGGKTNWNGRNFETLTYAAGLAARTRNVMTFSTVHAPLVNPVAAAKAITTIDHISGGRAGLNIVMGWYEKEMRMMGAHLRSHTDRYGYGAEWTRIVDRLWTETERFDFKGDYFELEQCEAEPKPIQPRPVVLNAGASADGIEFSARYADFNFASFTTSEQASSFSRKIRERAHAEYQREIGLITLVVVVCRDTEAEAQAAFKAIIDQGDWGAADNFLSDMNTSLKEHMKAEFRARAVAGSGGYALIGTPEMIVDGLRTVKDAGMDCVLLGVLDYLQDLKFFGDRVMPLLKQAGLRL